MPNLKSAYPLRNASQHGINPEVKIFIISFSFRRVIRFSIALLSAGMLAACGGGGGTKNTVGTTTAENTGGTTTVVVTPVAVQYVSSTPVLIFLAGTPGNTQSNVNFRVVGALNQPVAGSSVLLQLVDLSSGASLLNASADGTRLVQTGADGAVSVTVLAGTVPGAIRVRATVLDAPTITAISQELTVAVGRPAQRGLSLAPTSLSIEGLNIDGIESDITLSLSDRNGNPVPDGTQVNFVSEAGVLIPASCVVGAGSSRCTVRLRSQGVRPSDGRVTVLAYSPGEEDFVDLNGNNRWDAGEVFTDLGQAYRDDNGNTIFDSGEFFIPRTGAGGCAGGPFGRPGTCDGLWGEADIRAQAVIVFASSFAQRPGTTSVSLSALGASGAFSITVNDTNGNNMAVGTTLVLEPRLVQGSACVASVFPTQVNNQTAPTTVLLSYENCQGGDSLVFNVRSPSGATTSWQYQFVP